MSFRIKHFIIYFFLISPSVLAQDTLNYIFVGHTYDYQSWGRKVDPKIEKLPFDEYDRVWMGGDITAESMYRRSTVEYIDSIFNLSRPEVQWALGNHDLGAGNIQWYRELTGKKSFNVYSKNKAITLCWNTFLNPSLCEDLEAQYQMFMNVYDTISAGSHLFIIMHVNPFRGVPGLPEPWTYSHSNVEYWNVNCDSAGATFLNIIYPKLVELKARGVDSYCILGDTGDGVKKFYKPSDDGIHFFANGIGLTKYANDSAALATQAPDQVLIFQHILNNNEVQWKFHELDSLSNAQ
ncbi:MAG: hypothetical protein MRY83_11775 [Flavobacteriales bacterium]|nr:hypothetical protein [Flavobacteriales bacterium]